MDRLVQSLDIMRPLSKNESSICKSGESSLEGISCIHTGYMANSRIDDRQCYAAICMERAICISFSSAGRHCLCEAASHVVAAGAFSRHQSSRSHQHGLQTVGHPSWFHQLQIWGECPHSAPCRGPINPDWAKGHVPPLRCIMEKTLFRWRSKSQWLVRDLIIIGTLQQYTFNSNQYPYPLGGIAVWITSIKDSWALVDSQTQGWMKFAYR